MILNDLTPLKNWSKNAVKKLIEKKEKKEAKKRIKEIIKKHIIYKINIFFKSIKLFITRREKARE